MQSSLLDAVALLTCWVWSKDVPLPQIWISDCVLVLVESDWKPEVQNSHGTPPWLLSWSSHAKALSNATATARKYFEQDDVATCARCTCCLIISQTLKSAVWMTPQGHDSVFSPSLPAIVSPLLWAPGTRALNAADWRIKAEAACT